MGYLKYLKHAKKAVFKNNIMPEFVVFFVTDKCNFKCKHCFFYKNLNRIDSELNLDEIKRISDGMDEFIVLDITGGEPFIRDDISDIVKIFYDNNKIMNAVIVTNGWFTEKIKKHVGEILKHCPELHLLLNISIDAVGKEFDEIKGMDHAYERGITTFKEMDALREENARFQLGIVMTYSTLNQEEIIDTYYEVKKNLHPDSVKVAIIRGAPKDVKIKDINLNNYIKLSKIIENDLLKGSVKGFRRFPFRNIVTAANILSYEENIKMWETNRCLTPCFACMLNVIFYSDGDVHACELMNSSIGSFRENNYNFKKIWRSEKAVEFRKFVKKSRCFCTHECQLYTNILFNVRYYPRIFKYLVKYLLAQQQRKKS